MKPIGGRGETSGDWMDAETVAAMPAKRKETRDAIVPNGFETESWSAGKMAEELKNAMGGTLIYP